MNARRIQKMIEKRITEIRTPEDYPSWRQVEVDQLCDDDQTRCLVLQELAGIFRRLGDRDESIEDEE